MEFEQKKTKARVWLYKKIDLALCKTIENLNLEGDWEPVSQSLDFGGEIVQRKDYKFSVHLTRRTRSILFLSVTIKDGDKILLTSQVIWGKV